MENFIDNVPPELQAYRQFVAWRYEPNGNNEPKKCPIEPHTGLKANITDPSTWGSFDEAIRCAEACKLDGIGFVFTEDDPFAGIDLDDCIDDDGVPEAWALEVIAGFATYCEVSPSGRGFKLFVRGELPGGGTKKGQVELYDRNRFFTLTGKKFGSHDVVGDRQGALEDLYQKVKPHLTSPRRNDPDLTPGDSVDIPDSLLLQKARENRRTGSCSSGSSIAARRKGTARTLKRIWLLWAASRFGRTATRFGCLGSSMRQRSGSARSGRAERSTVRTPQIRL